jgi:HAD superfamily hydrolase (TIGR01509 family)
MDVLVKKPNESSKDADVAPPLVATGGPRAVILDFDGVVVDSLPVHLDAWRAAVAAVFRVALPDPETLVGHSTRTIAGILAKRFGNLSRARELAEVKRRLLAERYGELPLLPGARELIAEMRRRGLPYGIASNSPSPFVTGAVAALSLDVAVVFAADDMRRGKPHPDIFWSCGNALGIAPGARGGVLVFEDSRHGLEGARAAGMVPIGVASAHTEAQLRAAGAVAVCRDLGDALARGWLDAVPRA